MARGSSWAYRFSDVTVPDTVHATCVAIDRSGLLIKGRSGSGKSGLALQLMALGATLVADDRVVLQSKDGLLWASCPGPLTGKIEARGVGILNAVALTQVAVKAVVDMDIVEVDRIPEERHISLCGFDFPLLYNVEGIHFVAALMQFMRGGRDA